MIRVVLVDDQELIREGLRTIIDTEDDLEVVGEAADGDEAVRLTLRRRPDVVVMDVRMPAVDGIEATRRLRAIDGLTARVLVLTTFDVDENVHAALAAGASGFALKSAPRHQLVAAIRTVADGDFVLAPAVAARLVDRVRDGGASASARSPLLDTLSPRELEVFTLVAGGRSNAEIAGELHVAPTTVKTHIGALLSKLRCRDRVQLVVAAYESGLVRPRRPDAPGRDAEHGGRRL